MNKGQGATKVNKPDLFAFIRRLARNAIFVRFRACRSSQKAFGSKPSLQQLANCRRSARHTLRKAEIVDGSQLVGVKHNLEAFSTQPC
jgi:hypothetical protein